MTCRLQRRLSLRAERRNRAFGAGAPQSSDQSWIGGKGGGGFFAGAVAVGGEGGTGGVAAGAGTAGGAAGVTVAALGAGADLIAGVSMGFSVLRRLCFVGRKIPTAATAAMAARLAPPDRDGNA